MSTTTDAVEAIQALREQWPLHFNSGRITELGELFYAPDAYALPGGSDIVRGRADIVAFLQAAKDGGEKVHFELGVIDTSASGDMGYLVGNYVFTDAAGDTFPGLTHEAYRRQADGSWQCVVDMWHHIDA